MCGRGNGTEYGYLPEEVRAVDDRNGVHST